MKFRITFKHVVGCFLASIIIASCNNGGTSVNPQILNFNYVVRGVRDPRLLVRDINNRQRTISGLLGSNPCIFTADFSSPTPPNITINGNPDRRGCSVIIISTAPHNSTSTNSTNCSPIEEIEIDIGNNSEWLDLGEITSFLQGKITLSSGRQFIFGDYFQAHVYTFDTATRRATGDFQFISSLSGNRDSVLIAEGSFALTP